ncbi:MAG: universal stress protein [Myxococcota bacterium]|jgi:nucleotide-binding universal stress UspA family protein|nr:universal stress protein [Myxococcota bacterium]
MYKRILVGLDGSAASLRALDRALALATASGAQLTLLAVAEQPLVDESSIVELGRLREQRKAELSETLAAARERAGSAVVLDSVLEVGAARKVIVDFARRNDVDLVVLGGVGHGFLNCGLLGCTACDVVKNAPCSVLVVRDEPNQPKS